MSIGGIILAGGKSQRMGQDKGLMLLHNKPLISYAIEALSPLVEDLIIIAHDHKYQQFGFKVVPDLIPGSGPLGGIYTGLKESTHAVNLVLSCDTPFVSTDLFSFLIERKSRYDVVIPRHKNGTEPLAAIFDKACETYIRQLIDEGDLKMRKAVQQLNAIEVPITEEHTFYKAHLFDNLNTIEALEKAQRVKTDFH